MSAPFSTYRMAGLTFVAAALVAVYYIHLCLRDGVMLASTGSYERGRQPVIGRPETALERG
jgi:hypothetical protein